MNNAQRRLLGLCALVAAGMLIFPPFQAEFRGITQNLGYHFVAEPPMWRNVTATVNTPLLAVQLVGLAMVGAAMWLLVGDKRHRRAAARSPTLTDPMSRSLEDVDAGVPTPAPPAVDQSKSFLGGHYHPWRRYFARLIDYGIFGFGLGVFATAVLPDFASYSETAGSGFWLSISCLLALATVPIEALLISSKACTTPGKWLLGIRVVAADGQPLPFNRSFARAFTIWFQGVAIGLPVLPLFTMFFSYRQLTRTGATAWDESTDAKVKHGAWSPEKVVLAVIVVAALMLANPLFDLSSKARSIPAQRADTPSEASATLGLKHFTGEDRLLLGRPGPRWVSFEEASSDRLRAEGEAIKAYRRGDFTVALDQLVAVANQGSATAQFYVGEMLLNGRGVAKDEANAFQWYLAAASQGYTSAATTVGVLYLKGIGVGQDIAAGAEWSRRAADARVGDGIAEYNLGILNEAGLFGDPDHTSAQYWYEAGMAKARSEDIRALAVQSLNRLRSSVGNNQARYAASPPSVTTEPVIAKQPMIERGTYKKNQVDRPCIYKPVMTNDDYRACGLRPPGQP